MLYDMTNEPDSEEDLQAAKENAKNRFQLWRKRSIYSTALLLLSFAAAYPFVDGRQLSIHGEATKQLLLLLSLGMLIVTLYCTVLFWASWQCIRELK